MIFAGRLTERLQFFEITETQSRSGFKSTAETFKFEVFAERMKNKETIQEIFPDLDFSDVEAATAAENL